MTINNKEIENRINTFSKNYKNKYGNKVFKLGLSTSLPCPQRLQNSPCSFCVADTFIDNELKNIPEISQQIDFLISKISDKVFKVNQKKAYIAYFQENTSSYGNLDYLYSLFKQADNHPQILEIIISTRPDYLSADFLKMLKNLSKPVKLEIGIQTIHDKSLKLFNRNHTQQDNINAINLLSENSVDTGVHLIIGSPLETLKDILETIDWVNNQAIISDVKLHNLIVYKDAEISCKLKEQDIINLEQYIQYLTEIIKNLRPNMIISRLFTSNLNRHQKMLNNFPGIKKHWLNCLKDNLNKNDIYQGQNYRKIRSY